MVPGRREQRFYLARDAQDPVPILVTGRLLAFKAGAAPRPLPRGADRAGIEAAFPGWSVTDTEAAVTDGMPRPLRKAAPAWYRLRRHS